MVDICPVTVRKCKVLHVEGWVEGECEPVRRDECRDTGLTAAKRIAFDVMFCTEAVRASSLK
jgi:hypothetical protein